MNRPLPPEMSNLDIEFQPDQDGLGAWARDNFIEPGSPLTNPDHEHLQYATIGWLWANTAAEFRGKRFAGEARMLKPAPAKWSSLMAEQQMRGWFDGGLPDFLIVLDAEYAQTAPDDAFCALVEHELYHCGQDIDLFGAPRFKDDGSPAFAMKAHDVEQFVGVVERYGAAAAGVQEMVDAAKRGPIVQDGAVSAACGTCSKRRAA